MTGRDDAWRRADDAFDRALDLPAAERARFLAELSATDPELHAEVQGLLRAHDRSESFLDEPAPAFGAALLPDFSPSMPDLPAGTRVGSYAILARLGSGGMGVVYKAHDERLDRFVALKFLPPDLDEDEEARSRFLTEARIASALDHPGIAVVHEIAETADHHVFVAMAFYEGATLRDTLVEGPLPLDTCVDLGIQIAEALAAAHRHGIVHSDIKPANVIVTQQGIAKIVDFGIARIVEAESAGRSTGEAARGSPGYMSPEQRGGGEVDARADVWSFGVLLHEMLTGRRPAHHSAPASDLPAAFRPLLARCLHPDPANRYADASELLAELRAAASSLSGGRARRRWATVAAAVGVVGLAVAAGALTLWNPAAPPGTAVRQDSLPAMDVTTTSLVAYRFYQEGQRSYGSGDYHNAVRLFDAALAEDSAFAMAAHYGWLARSLLDQPLPAGALEELLRLAAGVSEVERREIRASWMFPAGELDSLAIAGTLPTLDPSDQQGHYFRGLSRVDRGDALGALADLRRAVALASEDGDGGSALCRECDALAALATAYFAVDSLAAAERVTREWIRRQPGSARAWRNLVVMNVAEQQYEEAAAANRRAIELSPGHPRDAMYPAESRIRQAEFDVADRLLQDLARDGATVLRADAAWFQTISFRYQGRLDEALAAIERFETATPADPGARLHRAQVLLEMGREAEAAALFDSSASLARSSAAAASVAARQETWSLTHRATALAAAGDTGSLASLADTIEAVGARSYYGRDPFLHHHVRGLLLASSGDFEAAAAEFCRAVYSPTVGYTRTNVELARVLIELGRPLDAVAILRPALRGPLEASNLYATHTEIHELLGRAWHAAGRADSARVHDEWVLKAWKNADPGFEQRREAVRDRAGASTGSRPGN